MFRNFIYTSVEAAFLATPHETTKYSSNENFIWKRKQNGDRFNVRHGTIITRPGTERTRTKNPRLHGNTYALVRNRLQTSAKRRADKYFPTVKACTFQPGQKVWYYTTRRKTGQFAKWNLCFIHLRLHIPTRRGRRLLRRHLADGKCQSRSNGISSITSSILLPSSSTAVECTSSDLPLDCIASKMCEASTSEFSDMWNLTGDDFIEVPDFDSLDYDFFWLRRRICHLQILTLQRILQQNSEQLEHLLS